MSEEVIESPTAVEPGLSSPIEESRESLSGRFVAFRALRHRNFRLFFTGQLTSLTGT